MADSGRVSPGAARGAAAGAVRHRQGRSLSRQGAAAELHRPLDELHGESGELYEAAEQALAGAERFRFTRGSRRAGRIGPPDSSNAWRKRDSARTPGGRGGSANRSDVGRCRKHGAGGSGRRMDLLFHLSTGGEGPGRELLALRPREYGKLGPDLPVASVFKRPQWMLRAGRSFRSTGESAGLVRPLDRRRLAAAQEGAGRAEAGGYPAGPAGLCAGRAVALDGGGRRRAVSAANVPGRRRRQRDGGVGRRMMQGGVVIPEEAQPAGPRARQPAVGRVVAGSGGAGVARGLGG